MIALVVGLLLKLADAQITTCSVLTQISPYILAYTMVDYQGAESVCAGFGGSLAAYTSTLNTQFGLWTEICNFYYNSVGQTVTTTGYTPPFWVQGTTVVDTSTQCAVLPYGAGQAVLSTVTESFADCRLSFYPLCQQPATTETAIVGTTVNNSFTTVSTVSSVVTVTETNVSEQFTTNLSIDFTTNTVVNIDTDTELSATTTFITDLLFLSGSTTTTRTRTVSSVQTNQAILSTTTTTTTTISSTTSTQSTTTTTTLRTVFSCVL